MDENERTERKVWERFLNKHISLLKKSGGNDRFYNGKVVRILDDKLILDDRKLGEIPLTFEGLSVIGIEEGDRDDN